jgi:hypothetical protein
VVQDSLQIYTVNNSLPHTRKKTHEHIFLILYWSQPLTKMYKALLFRVYLPKQARKTHMWKNKPSQLCLALYKCIQWKYNFCNLWYKWVLLSGNFVTLRWKEICELHVGNDVFCSFLVGLQQGLCHWQLRTLNREYLSSKLMYPRLCLHNQSCPGIRFTWSVLCGCQKMKQVFGDEHKLPGKNVPRNKKLPSCPLFPLPHY